MPKVHPPKADPTSLRIPPDLKRDLKRLAPLEAADVERRSMTWLILRILRQWVDWKKKNPPSSAAGGSAGKEKVK